MAEATGNKSSRSFYIALFIAVILPIVSFTFWEIKKQSDGFRIAELPHLSLDSIPEFSFTNQVGNTITRDSIIGRITVADFFFTTCPGICPKMSGQMEYLQTYLKQQSNINPNWRLLSHTVNPSVDSVGRMLQYSEIYNADPEKWWLLTGNKEELYNLSKNFYKLPAIDYSADSTLAEPYTHSERFVLLDRAGFIRGYYDGTDSTAVRKLMKDIVILDLTYTIDAGKEAKRKKKEKK